MAPPSHCFIAPIAFWRFRALDSISSRRAYQLAAISADIVFMRHDTPQPFVCFAAASICHFHISPAA